MKVSLIIGALFAGLVAAVPVGVSVENTVEAHSLETRDSSTSNDLVSGSCLPIIFIFARGSTEPGNMGTLVGPEMCSGLKSKYPNAVACQGVGGAYTAEVQSNLLPKGTTDASIAAGLSMLNLAFTKCPSSKVVFSGYSQGSAVMEYAVEGLPQASQNKLVGGVFFGYTQNEQTDGTIPGFPSSKLKIICHFGDVLCWGIPMITPAHLTYGADTPTAVAFLAGLLGNV